MAKSSQKGLGKGLGALFSESPELIQEQTADRGAPRTLPIQKLEPNPDQPRKDFEPEALAELAESIRTHGLIQPITVRLLESGYYQIIAGERRWRASREAGLTEVPVTVLDVDDRTAAQLALIENLQREDLNPVEEARGYHTLMESYALTQEQVADSIGKSRSAVTNTLRLLRLPEEILTMLEQGGLSAGHARALLALEDRGSMVRAAEKIVSEQMSVRQTEQLVKRLRKEPVPREQSSKDPLAVDYIRECEKALGARLGRKVTIKSSRGRGRIELEFYGDEDLQTLLDALDPGTVQ